MDDIQYKREHRLQRRLERLESNNPDCLICGEDDSICLRWHHPLHQRGFPNVRIRVCSNDHDRLHELEKDWLDFKITSSLLVIAAVLIFVFADFVSLINHESEEFIGHLREIATALLDKEKSAIGMERASDH